MKNIHHLPLDEEAAEKIGACLDRMHSLIKARRFSILWRLLPASIFFYAAPLPVSLPIAVELGARIGSGSRRTGEGILTAYRTQLWRCMDIYGPEAVDRLMSAHGVSLEEVEPEDESTYHDLLLRHAVVNRD